MVFHGSDGIPRKGHEEEYATELWLDGPSAFWLHPEGPFSETTLDEWRLKRAEEDRRRREAQAQNPYANAYQQMAGLGIQGSAYASLLQGHANQLQGHRALQGLFGSAAAALLGV